MEQHRAIALLNLGDSIGNISAHLSGDAGDDFGGSAAIWSVRDVWSNVTKMVKVGVGEAGVISAMVRPHEVKLYRVWKMH